MNEMLSPTDTYVCSDTSIDGVCLCVYDVCMYIRTLLPSFPKDFTQVLLISESVVHGFSMGNIIINNVQPFFYQYLLFTFSRITITR